MGSWVFVCNGNPNDAANPLLIPLVVIYLSAQMVLPSKLAPVRAHEMPDMSDQCCGDMIWNSVHQVMVNET